MVDEDEFDDDADSEAELLPCPACGAMIYEDTEKCPVCGDWIMPQTFQRRLPTWARVTAGVIAAVFMLGVLAGLIGLLI